MPVYDLLLMSLLLEWKVANIVVLLTSPDEVTSDPLCFRGVSLIGASKNSR